MVERYAEGLDPDDEPRGVERTVAVKTDHLAISGRVDRIDARPDLVIVDYKTGRRPCTTDEARSSLALALYVLGARRTLRSPCTTVELHHVPSGEVSGWEHTEESLARHLRRAESIAAEAGGAEAAARAAGGPDAAAEALDELFPPKVGALCGWCDFARHCPQGRAAAPTKVPWAAVLDDGGPG
jgi:RecB family exonuclease